jgi:hypothetical protein
MQSEWESSADSQRPAEPARRSQPSRLRVGVIVGAAAIGAALGGAAIAGAATSGTTGASPAATGTAPSATAMPPGNMPDPATMTNGPGETLLTGTTADKVKAAALAAVPGATVIRVETDSAGSPYEAHLRKADGSEVTVKVDTGFAATTTEQGFGGGPGGGGPHDGTHDGPHDGPGYQGAPSATGSAA